MMMTTMMMMIVMMVELAMIVVTVKLAVVIHSLRSLRHRLKMSPKVSDVLLGPQDSLINDGGLLSSL